MASFSERFSYIMATRNLRQVDVIDKCKPFCKKYGVQIRKEDISQYLSGKFLPNQYRITILSMALNVDVAYLMGWDDKPQQMEQPLILQKYNSLSPEHQQAVDSLIETFLYQENKKSTTKLAM